MAHSKLENVFAGFNQIFDTVHRSETLRKNLDGKTRDFVKLLLAAKEVELELRALDENKFSQTMEELCKDNSDNLWLKCTHGN